MGIKNRLEQVDGQLEKPAKLADVVVEEPVEKKGLEFDVESEVSEEEVRELKVYFEDCSQVDNWSRWRDASGFAVSFKNLFPDRIAELRLDGSKWEKMKAVYNKFYNEGKKLRATKQALYLKILFPDRVKELDLDSEWEEFKSEFDVVCTDNDWFYATNQAMRLKILFPEKISELELEEKWTKMKEEYKDYYSLEDWWHTTVLAVGLKILFPDRVKELKLEERWENMKGLLRRYSQNRKQWSFAMQASYLKILASKEVKITDQGMELVVGNNEDFEDKVGNRPERLKRE